MLHIYNIIDRDELMAYLAGKGIETRPVWYLNHLQKPYKRYQCYKIELSQKIPKLQKKTTADPTTMGLQSFFLAKIEVLQKFKVQNTFMHTIK